MEPPSRIVAIVNPSTGRTPTDAIVSILTKTARTLNVHLTIERTRRPGHAMDISRRLAPTADIVIAVGGDGTVSDVVTGALGSDALIGIVPTGSTNMVAKDLGIPRDPGAAAHIAMGEGRPQAIDVARAGDTAFIHMAGAGYDAAIMRDTSPTWKRRIGWMAYLPAAIRHVQYPRFQASLMIDGLEVRRPARLVLCAVGGSIIQPRFKVGSGINRFDGMLDVCVYDPPGIPATLATFAWIAVGHPERSRWYARYRGRRISVSADRNVPFEVDGDYIGSLPIEIEIVDSPVRVLVPRTP